MERPSLALSVLPPPDTQGTINGPLYEDVEVLSNECIGGGLYSLSLLTPTIVARVEPGQFAMVTVAGAREHEPVLPRPMAIYNVDVASGSMEIIYRVVGRGTGKLSRWEVGERLAVVAPLGRHFELSPATRSLLLVGRGIGMCSLTLLAQQAIARNVAVEVLSSARSPSSAVGTGLLRDLGATVQEVTDLNGTSHITNVRNLLSRVLNEHDVQQIATCGSNRLLHLCADLGHAVRADVQVSIEARMACGLGYCHGCSSGEVGLTDEAPLVCRDGPVFRLDHDATADQHIS